MQVDIQVIKRKIMSAPISSYVQYMKTRKDCINTGVNCILNLLNEHGITMPEKQCQHKVFLEHHLGQNHPLN